MKIKAVAVIALAVSLLAAPCAFASSVGNEVEGQGNFKISAGSEWNIVRDKEIDPATTTSSSRVSLTDFEFDYSQIYGKLAVGITDYLNIYTKLGGVQVDEARLKWSDGSEVKIESDPSFLWAVGVTAAYTFKDDNWAKDFFVGVNNEFNSWGVDVDKLTVTGYTVTNIEGHIWNWEYQLTGYVGRRFAFEQLKTVIKPYIGMMWDYFRTESDEDIKYTIGSTRYTLTYELENEDQIGMVVGADVTLFDHLVLNVEGRFITETAITFGGSFKF